jgi:mono/diheme cytochrome c family protein
MTRSFALLLTLAAAGATFVPISRGRAQVRSPAGASGGAQASALEAWGEVYRVLSSPRCANCHPAGDAPLQGDVPRPHAMAITRRSPAVGLSCGACHRDRNAELLGGPPGVPGWRMPPADVPMVFTGRSSRELCMQLHDPKATGGRSLQALVHHLESDELVHWAFAPGPGRTLPPISHRALVAAAERWVAGGAPCP